MLDLKLKLEYRKIIKKELAIIAKLLKYLG